MTLGRWRLDRLLLFGLTGLAVATGLLLRVSLLGSGSLWMDELWTLDAVSRSFEETIRARLVSDPSPPLWTTLSWVWLHLTGTYDAAWMRILAAAFSCLAIAAPIAGAVRMPALRPALLVTASLFALSLFTVQYGVEFRTYSLMMGLGVVATVIWAGLLTAELPASGAWIFAFALTGALAGFGHYYGNLLYGSEMVVLLAALALGRRWLSARLLFAWGALSFLPVLVWLVATSHWMPNLAVAAPPSFSEIGTWLGYAFGPVTTLLANEPPGYAQGAKGYGAVVAALTVTAIVAAVIAWALPRKGRLADIPPVTAAGACAILVVVLGVCAAWYVSLLKPPSMNVRNLAALLPAAFLAVGCACTLVPERARWVTASIAVAAVLAANGAFVSQYGVASLTPPWQAQAGYRDAARVLISASHESPVPTLVGLNTSWGWHGQWDVAIRAELGAGPADSSDPEPLDVRWVDGVGDIGPGETPHLPLVVFSDSPDQRTSEVFAWAEKTAGPCTQSTFGGPAYGLVILLRCG